MSHHQATTVVLFHRLSEPWPETSYWLRVFHRSDGARTPVAGLARVIKFNKKDVLYVMQQEGIQSAPATGYTEGSILLTDLPRLLRSPLFQLNWSDEQMDAALRQLDKFHGRTYDGGLSHRYDRGTTIQPRLGGDAADASASSLEYITTRQRSVPETKKKRERNEEPKEVATNPFGLPTYPPEWEALLNDQIASIHELALSSFRGNPKYEEMKAHQRKLIEMEFREKMRPDAIKEMEARAQRECMADILKERRAEINQRVGGDFDGFLTFHLPAQSGEFF